MEKSNADLERRIVELEKLLSQVTRNPAKPREWEWYCPDHKRTFVVGEECPGCDGLDPTLGKAVA